MNAPPSYRPLTDSEIQQLRGSGCTSDTEDWSNVRVSPQFDARRVRDVDFVGPIRIGALGNGPEREHAAAGPAEIRRARLVDCRLGDRVRVVNVGRTLQGYDIEDGACVEDVGLMTSGPEANFGLGTAVQVVNEAGGREVLLFDELSAQFAWLMCFCRYRPGLVEALRDIAGRSVRAIRHARGVVGAGAYVASVPAIIDVRIGPHARVEGAASLANGSILSHADAPTRVGSGVQARDFLVAEGASVQEGALIAASYVGQGCQVGRQFSADHCLLFANCEAFHGESCSALWGPYTVSHHKSSLLIAGLFSFFNAGSGTNQSNHMYKLGPVHEGKLARGCKTGSSAYLLWPCHVGPFSVILGKHPRGFDTSDLPFSHLDVGDDGRTYLIPGVNLTTVGTVRDQAKWSRRDRRAGCQRDLITRDVVSPYTVGGMLRGLRLLEECQQRTPRSVDTVALQGVMIKRVFLRTGQKYYRRAVGMYLAERIVERIRTRAAAGSGTLRDALAVDQAAVYSRQWRDVGGLLMPADRLETLCRAIERNEIDDAENFQAAVEATAQAHDEDEWVWVRQTYRDFAGLDLDHASPGQLEQIAESYLASRREFLELILLDAQKEFDPQSYLGFGVDGSPEQAAADFQAVRGDYEGNAFVRDVRQQIDALAAQVAECKEMLSQL
jgi:hypothetical protein